MPTTKQLLKQLTPEDIKNIQARMQAEDLWNSMGYVYVIKCDKYYKIGRAFNVYNRLTVIKVSSPFQTDLILAGKVKDNIDIEKKLHNLFKDKHHKGEWYLLNKKDLYKIKDILEQEQATLQNIVYDKGNTKTENSN